MPFLTLLSGKGLPLVLLHSPADNYKTLHSASSPQIPVHEPRIRKHHKHRSGDGVELPVLRVDIAELVFEQQANSADDEI